MAGDEVAACKAALDLSLVSRPGAEGKPDFSGGRLGKAMHQVEKVPGAGAFQWWLNLHLPGPNSRSIPASAVSSSNQQTTCIFSIFI